jgi:hypothetical protein
MTKQTFNALGSSKWSLEPYRDLPSAHALNKLIDTVTLGKDMLFHVVGTKELVLNNKHLNADSKPITTSSRLQRLLEANGV